VRPWFPMAVSAYSEASSTWIRLPAAYSESGRHLRSNQTFVFLCIYALTRNNINWPDQLEPLCSFAPRPVRRGMQ